MSEYQYYEVRIYDCVEPEHPLTSHMFRKRMTAYRQLGYVPETIPKCPNAGHLARNHIGQE